MITTSDKCHICNLVWKSAVFIPGLFKERNKISKNPSLLYFSFSCTTDIYTNALSLSQSHFYESHF